MRFHFKYFNNNNKSNHHQAPEEGIGSFFSLFLDRQSTVFVLLFLLSSFIHYRFLCCRDVVDGEGGGGGIFHGKET